MPRILAGPTTVVELKSGVYITEVKNFQAYKGHVKHTMIYWDFAAKVKTYIYIFLDEP